jgi:hypothetical protein
MAHEAPLILIVQRVVPAIFDVAKKRRWRRRELQLGLPR